MEIRGVHFAPIFIASGAAGFFDPKEYWYHRLGSPWKIAGLTFARAGITAKTMTLLPTKGNLPMQSDGVTPKEWMPKCMVVNSLKQVVLNSVGLSNRGAPDLLARNIWQQRTGGPFRLSFMAPFRENETTQDRLDQYQELTKILLKERTHTWRSEIGLEVNISCPNTYEDPSHFRNETGQILDITGALNIPTLCKVSAVESVQVVAEIAKHPHCDAITMSNSIPWGKLPNQIDWKGLFGTTESPLAHIGKGGLSGWPLRRVIIKWLQEAADSAFPKPVSACGGINSAQAAREVCAIPIVKEFQVGTAGMLYPWRMKSIIGTAYELFH